MRDMEGKKGKKGYVEPEDRKGGKIKWDRVEDSIDNLCKTWGVRAGKTRLGEFKGNAEFQRKLGQFWQEWETQTNLWWTEVCEEQKSAGGWLKVGQGSIQDLVKAKKARAWNCSSAWEWIERRMQEAIGTWAKRNPSTG